jgi:tetratricopeptide (TPR) repeat protein
VDEAITHYRKAIELNPKHALAHNNLGNALDARGQVDEAITHYRKAIELDPKHGPAHNNLGLALYAKGQRDEAIALHRKAIELDPKSPEAHCSLGAALSEKGQVDEAIACYKKAIELDPKYAEAYCNLGNALAGKGRFAESLAAYRRGHELGTQRPGWPYRSAEWVPRAEELAALEAKLPAFLQGKHRPGDNKERLGLAAVCQAKKLHHARTRLYLDAFAADPKLADDLKAGHRYSAACSAALAAAGQGEDAAGLDEKQRARLRQQALDWLSADLALHAKRLPSGKPADRAAVQSALRLWQKDADLAGLRDRDALAKLPAQEQKAFAQLWADVAALLKQAETPAKKEEGGGVP